MKEFFRHIQISMKNKSSGNTIVQMKSLVLWMLLFLFLCSIITSVYFLIKRYKSDKVQKTNVSWQVDIPKNYNIKNSHGYTSNDFKVFYSEYLQKYYVTVKSGQEYDFEEIKIWIVQQLIKFDDFSGMDKKEIENVLDFSDERFVPKDQSTPPDINL